ncbi:hypothetical protein B0T19DRAFT_87875 [Cercophora scortea]|uniref:Uncharacterized protein n=1 Tax=Cercophora scortea TaxID=314031 RepID=A0AAE0MI48_9PEZI|nr:hypothetical protein B0T19DRAFT_87875 [Cercophora scortea]
MDGHIDSCAEKAKPKTYGVVRWASDETRMASDCPLARCCSDKNAVHYTRTDCPLDKCGEKITIPEPHRADEKCSDKTTFHHIPREYLHDKVSCGEKTVRVVHHTEYPMTTCSEKAIPAVHSTDYLVGTHTEKIIPIPIMHSDQHLRIHREKKVILAPLDCPLVKHKDETAHHVVHAEYPVHCQTLDPSTLHCEETTCNLNRDPHCSGAIITTTYDLEHRDNCKPTDNVHGCGRPDVPSKPPPCHMAAKKCHRGNLDHRECSFDRDEYRACDDFDFKEDEEPGCKDASSGQSGRDPHGKDVGRCAYADKGW